MVLELSPYRRYRKSTSEDTLVEIIDSSVSPSRASSTSTAIEPVSFYGTRKSNRVQKTTLAHHLHPTTRESSAQTPRKRTLSNTAAETPQTKKLKITITSGLDRAFALCKEERDYASKRWLFHHRHIFQPLFANEKNTYFEQLKDEAKRWKKDEKAFIPFQELVEQPSLLKNGEMKDYQLHGLSYLTHMYKNGMNCILGDEMGLGKTMQTLSLFAYIHEHTPETKRIPHLVICPLSVLSSWENECKQWFPSFEIIRYHGPETERNRIKAELVASKKKFDILLTTYDQFAIDDKWFKTRRWCYCVLDEGHKVKNSRSNVSSSLLGLGSLYRLILTGTPLQNNMVELWSLLHWLYPSIFRESTERKFISSFDMNQGSYDMDFLSAARGLLEVIMLRRTKATVDVNVPPKEEMTVFLPLSEAQRFWTYRMLTKVDSVSLSQIFGEDEYVVKKEEDDDSDVEIIDDPMDVAAGRKAVLKHIMQQQSSPKKADSMNVDKWKKLMNLLMQLRKVCDHPYLLPGAEPEPYHIGEHIVASSAKLVAIDKILGEVIPKGEKVLIFSQWIGMLDILEDFMALRGYRYARLDGSVPRPRRTLDIKLFQRDDSPYQIYLILTKAGGLGINLTKATNVIMCDTDWNPQNDLQAIARAHRIGQKKTVKVYRLICRATVEDQMLDRLRRKLFLSVKVMSGNGSSSDSDSGASLGRGELAAILRNGSSALTRTDDGMSWSKFLDAPLAKILEASKHKSNMRDAKIRQQVGVGSDEDDDELLKDAEEEERELLKGIARVRCNIFEGEVVDRRSHMYQSNKEIAREWDEMQKRTRGNQLITVMGMSFRPQPNMVDYIVTANKPAATPKKKAGRSYESEVWCIYCRDGGELVLCSSCPRVFHAKCAGLTKADMRKSSAYCGQHNCGTCSRNTSQCGGMMFRCRTCPQAFCEDCIPFDDIIPIGDSIPEFEMLGYPAKSNAYFITCIDCQQEFKEEPELLEEWEQEWEQARKKLEKLRAH